MKFSVHITSSVAVALGTKRLSVARFAIYACYKVNVVEVNVVEVATSRHRTCRSRGVIIWKK
jgi:hypothetical protein